LLLRRPGTKFFHPIPKTINPIIYHRNDPKNHVNKIPAFNGLVCWGKFTGKPHDLTGKIPMVSGSDFSLKPIHSSH
jgi:hypothetical protein